MHARTHARTHARAHARACAHRSHTWVECHGRRNPKPRCASAWRADVHCVGRVRPVRCSGACVYIFLLVRLCVRVCAFRVRMRVRACVHAQAHAHVCSQLCQQLWQRLCHRMSISTNPQFPRVRDTLRALLSCDADWHNHSWPVTSPQIKDIANFRKSSPEQVCAHGYACLCAHANMCKACACVCVCAHERVMLPLYIHACLSTCLHLDVMWARACKAA